MCKSIWKSDFGRETQNPSFHSYSLKRNFEQNQEIEAAVRSSQKQEKVDDAVRVTKKKTDCKSTGSFSCQSVETWLREESIFETLNVQQLVRDMFHFLGCAMCAFDFCDACSF